MQMRTKYSFLGRTGGLKIYSDSRYLPAAYPIAVVVRLKHPVHKDSALVCIFRYAGNGEISECHAWCGLRTDDRSRWWETPIRDVVLRTSRNYI